MKQRFVLIVLLFAAVIGASEYATIQRDRAIVRNGPGSYYQIIAELEKGDSFVIKEENGGWLKMQKEKLEGYISQKVTIPRKSSEDIFSKMGVQKTDLYVSQHGMSAGVKGFAQKFTKKFSGSQDFITLYLNFNLDPISYKNFENATYKGFNLKQNYQNFKLPPPENKDYFSFPEEGMGIGIASHLANLGIYDDPKLTEYINQVGNIIVEATDAYDINFKIFILDVDEVNGYSCPGGIIFITLGMLKMVRTEAELACVLAHEIAHVERHHGMLEMEKRKHHIMSDNAFSEMDREMEEIGLETDKEYQSSEAEMEELCFDIYEIIVNGRLQEYEKEADQLAIIYASRAGYDGRQLLNLLQRLKQSATISSNEHYTPGQIEKRIVIVKEKLSHYNFNRELFDKYERFNSTVRF
ncbi:MAG: M48 family metalloprotease [Candidatus Cloacimonetes bacterium]|nr:M48 family metalloprotease [Candidatus Cloacimonadota bacterium]